MKRTHALLIALALGLAVIAGSFAALRSQHLAQHATGSRVGATQTQFIRQIRVLNRAEARLRAELRRHPQAIPVTQAPAPAPAPAAAPAAPMTQPATIVYHRPAPIVHVIHRHSGEHEVEHESQGGGGGRGDD